MNAGRFGVSPAARSLQQAAGKKEAGNLSAVGKHGSEVAGPGMAAAGKGTARSAAFRHAEGFCPASLPPFVRLRRQAGAPQKEAGKSFASTALKFLFRKSLPALISMPTMVMTLPALPLEVK